VENDLQLRGSHESSPPCRAVVDVVQVEILKIQLATQCTRQNVYIADFGEFFSFLASHCKDSTGSLLWGGYDQ